MKKLFTFSLIALGIVAILTAGTVITLKVMYPPERVKALVLPLITDAIQREVGLESAGLSLFPVLGVKLNGLTIANTSRPGFSKEPFVTVKAFVVKVSLPALLAGNITVASILLDSPDIIIETDRNGNLNTDDIGGTATAAAKPAAASQSGPTTDLPFALTLKELRLKDARFVYHDRQTGLKTVLGRINVTLAADADPSLKDIRVTGSIDIGGIALNAPDVPQDLPPITLKVNIDASVNTIDENITIKTLTLSLPPVDLAVSGSIMNYGGDPVLDLALNSGELDFNKILAAVPASVFPDKKDVKATGTALLSVTIKGKATETSTPKINGTLKVNDVTVQYAGLPESINGFKADIRFTDNSADIKTLKLNLGSNPVSVSGTVKNFALPDVDMAVSAKISLGSLKDVMALPEGTTLDGRVTADIKAKGLADPAAPHRLNLKGTLQLSGVTVKTPELAQPMKIDAITNFTSKKVTEKIDIRIGASDISVKADVDNVLALVIPQKDGKGPRASANAVFTSNLLDLDKALNLPEETAGNTQAASVPAGTAEPVRLLTEPLPPLDAKIRYNFKKIRFYNADLTAFSGTAKLDNGRFTFNTAGRMYTGTVKANAAGNLNDPQNISISTGAQLVNVEANDFISRFNNLLPATNPLYRKLRDLDNTVWGKISLQSDFKTNGATDLDMTKNLAGTADIQLHNGKLARSAMLQSLSKSIEKFYTLDDITFSELLVKTHIRNEEVYLDEFKLGSGEGDWDVGGKVSFDAILDCDVSNRLSKQQSDKIAALQNKGKGALKGLLKGTGLESAGSLLDGAGVPVDDAGRVTVLLGMKGDASSPKVSFKGFGKGTGTVVEQAGGNTVKNQAAQQLNEKKASVQQAVKTRTAKTRKQVEAKAADVQKKVRSEADVRKKQLAKEAAAKKKQAAAKAAELQKAAAQKKKQLEDAAKKKLNGLF